jgi:hypothetical protein
MIEIWDEAAGRAIGSTRRASARAIKLCTDLS